MIQNQIPESSTRLTPRQLEILRMVALFEQSRCYSPTMAEIACELCISRSTVFEHISELRAKGLLSGCPGRTRSLRLTCEAQKLLDRLNANGHSEHAHSHSAIPFAGRVAAGVPIQAVENVDCLSFDSCFGAGDDVFVLEVAGDSMADEDIRDGDYVVCRRTLVAENGQLVVAVVDPATARSAAAEQRHHVRVRIRPGGQETFAETSDDCATLKRFYKEKDAVRLQPANETYQPIYSDNCRIEAVVVGLIRKFCSARVT